MKARVVSLYEMGRRRSREACLADPGSTGELIIREIRSARHADLFEKWGLASQRPLVRPLFDVAVLRITSRGMLLRGYEIRSENTICTFLVQEWWCEIHAP